MVDALIGVEGGYANNPNDAGGETIWGITVAVARANGYTGAMRDMPREEAAAIYLREYFVTPGLDKVFLISPSIAEELFDTGVNMGVSVACRFLQRCLNVLDSADLTVDGALGAKSIAALNGYMAKRKSQGELVLLRALNALQGARYVEIAEGREASKAFAFGWFLNRVVM